MELFLVVWLSLCSKDLSIESWSNVTIVSQCSNNEVKSQTVTTEAELTELYEKHKYDGFRVWRVNSKEYFFIGGEWKLQNMNSLTELIFKESPCGKWVEK